MPTERKRMRTPAGDGVERRRFLRYGGAVAGLGLGSASVAADEESEPEGRMGPTPDADDAGTEDVPTVDPSDELAQTWYFTIYCPGLFCVPGPFLVTGLTKVEHVETGQELSFEERTWSQGYETVARTWELGTPNEWADELGLESPGGEWNIHGEMWRDGVLSDAATVTIEVEDDCRLAEKIAAKRDSIASVRDAAASGGFDRGIVDQEAEALLDGEIADDEGCADTDDDEELEQMEEALDRLLAAEEITESATEAGADDDGPVAGIVDALFRLAQTASVKLIEKVGGKLLRKVANRLVTFASKKTKNLLNSLSGRGVISSERYESILSSINRLETLSFYRFRALKNGDYDGIPDDADPVGNLYGTFADEGASAMNDAAEGLGVHDHLETDPIAAIREALETEIFEMYYTGDVPDIHVPAPEEIEVPDVDVEVDLPNEDLPPGIGDLVPDTIELDLDTPDVPLPDVPVLSDVHSVRDGIATPLGSTSGVNDSLESSVGWLASSMYDVDEQNPSARDHVRDVMANGIDAVDDTVESVIDAVENIRAMVGEAQDHIGTLISIMLAGGAILIVTGVGTVGLVAAAVKLMTITTVMTLFSALLDVFAIAVGTGTTLYFANLHHVGVTGILEDDLGGVNGG